MAEQREYYEKFAAVLRGGDASELGPWLADANHKERLAIHQGNFRVTASKAMQGIYKAVHRLVGDEYFEALMANFLADQPPKTATLTRYGEGFSDFLRAFAPVQEDLPWLAPVASLDWAWFAAYGAKNTPALTAKDLQGVAAELLPAHAPGLHPSVHLMRFSVTAYSIWRTNIEDEDVQAVPLETGQEWAVVWRENMQIRHQGIMRAQYIFLDAIGDGQALVEAWTAARQHDAQFDLAFEFAHWLNAGVFKGEKNG